MARVSDAPSFLVVWTAESSHTMAIDTTAFWTDPQFLPCNGMIEKNINMSIVLVLTDTAVHAPTP